MSLSDGQKRALIVARRNVAVKLGPRAGQLVREMCDYGDILTRNDLELLEPLSDYNKALKLMDLMKYKGTRGLFVLKQVLSKLCPEGFEELDRLDSGYVTPEVESPSNDRQQEIPWTEGRLLPRDAAIQDQQNKMEQFRQNIPSHDPVLFRQESSKSIEESFNREEPMEFAGNFEGYGRNFLNSRVCELNLDKRSLLSRLNSSKALVFQIGEELGADENVLKQARRAHNSFGMLIDRGIPNVTLTELCEALERNGQKELAKQLMH